MYYEFIQAHKRTIITTVVLFIVILFIWTAVILIGRIGKIATTIAVVPSDATVTIDGKKIGSGKQWIPAGTYNLVVQKDGFGTKKKTINITDAKQQNVTAVSLTPQSDDAKEWAREHEKDYSENERFGAIEANAEGKYFSELNPITTKLPFTDPYYTIGYTPTNDNSVDLTIATESPRYRFYAVEKIRELGYDPTDFKIIFKDFKNPLGVKDE
jgi:hypothetical protein